METRENTTFTAQSPNYTDAQSLQIRLDTSRLIREIENFLKGKTTYTTVEGDLIKEETLQNGFALMNQKGIQLVIMWVSSKINPMTVQGYIANRQDFNLFIADMYEDFTEGIYLNCVEWGMEDRNIRFLVSAVMDMIELFLSRTIENWERKLMNVNTESKSSNVAQSKGWGLPSFGGN